MEVFFLWFFFAIVVGVAASSRGRSGFGWFLLSIFISPLIGLLLVLVMPNLATAKIQAVAMAAAAEAPRPDTHVRCPDCRELVRRDARKCKHCGTVLTPQ